MFPKIIGTPKWMVKIMENPITMDDLGVPPFSETSKCFRKCKGTCVVFFCTCKKHAVIFCDMKNDMYVYRLDIEHMYIYMYIYMM